MLRTPGSSEGENQRDLPPPPPPPLLPPPLPLLPPPSIHMRQLVLTCAQLISRSDLAAAHRLIAVLSANSSAYGDSTDRLVHCFTKALNRRLIATSAPSTKGIDQTNHHHHHQSLMRPPQEPQNIHILDFDIMHGVQWPPLMQAIADRFPPPTLRITGTGNNLNILRRTGDRLSKFAHSLGLRFRFYPLLLANTNNVENVDHIIDRLSDVIILPNETLAVNCVLYLHRMLKNRDKLSAVFESLEATLPPNSRERIEVEQVWFGREIVDIVAEEGDNRKERHER
ncbi:scarecrow-like protein 18 [Tanacetum coccineum]